MKKLEYKYTPHDHGYFVRVEIFLKHSNKLTYRAYSSRKITVHDIHTNLRHSIIYAIICVVK